MKNTEYAQILSEIAILRSLRGDSPFKVRAFENASRTLYAMTDPIEDMLEAEEDITELDGIGKSIATEIGTIFDTGGSPLRAELLNELDPGLLELMKIQGLGPKRIKLLFDELGITNVELLKDAAEAGHIAALPGLGKKTEDKILSEIARLAETSGRIPLPAGRRIAESIRDQLVDLDGVEQIEIAGSIRRGKETIGDIDILVTTHGPHAVLFDAFLELPEVGEVLARGDTKTSARLRSGLQVDVRIVEPDQFGAALHYFTGSKEHNIGVRARAKKMGMRVNEYGVKNLEDGSWILTPTEEELFDVLDLRYIPPEIRLGRDEIDLAELDDLPDLVDEASLRGDLHMHTTYSDGRGTILEMAQAAKDRGYDYIVITDHSPAVVVANGMSAGRFREQITEIRQADKEIDDFEIFAGIEVDFLSDGELDMDHDLLAECDWVVGSVHSAFRQTEENMTARLIKGIQTGLISALGHPTGRKLGGREGYSWNFDEIIAACDEYGVAFEMNGGSGRLDMNSDLAARVHKRGAMIICSSDAHSTAGLNDIRFAVQQARRASLQKADILNTKSASEVFASVRTTL